MRNELTIKNYHSIHQNLKQSVKNQSDSFEEMISPWNNSSSRIIEQKAALGSSFNSKKRLFLAPNNGKLRNIQPANTKNQQYFSLKKTYPFTDCNYYPANFRQKTQPSSFNIKRSRQTKNRQKFTTPIVSINQHAFNEKIFHKFSPFISKTCSKEKTLIKDNPFEGSIFIENFSQIQSIRNDLPKIKKLFTYKVIPMQKQKQKNSNLLKKTMNQNLFINSGITLEQNLWRIVNTQIQPVIKRNKSKSLNKFNKTYS